MMKKDDFLFEEIDNEVILAEYTDGCSGDRSDCCTRVCTRDGERAPEAEWGKFLEINAGIIQY